MCILQDGSLKQEKKKKKDIKEKSRNSEYRMDFNE